MQKSEQYIEIQAVTVLSCTTDEIIKTNKTTQVCVNV